jgi:hypothetical protein
MAQARPVSLAEAFADAPEPTIKGPRCGVGRLLTSLPEADAEILRQVLANDAWTAKRIVERLGGAGHRVSKSAVARHRLGECMCATLGVA